MLIVVIGYLMLGVSSSIRYYEGKKNNRVSLILIQYYSNHQNGKSTREE